MNGDHVPPVSAGDLPTLAPAGGAAGAAPTTVGRYVVRAFHARGGLGEVYTATDTELDREVAFKRIQPQHADHPRSRRRFVTEAALTARLDHPGVVPVFGLVTDPGGRPCYAMRFVRGETLGDQIAAFHSAGEAGNRELGFRQLLQRFVAVCNTVGFAHSKGVIHRDIKPANVMVGAFGEVQVMDWGLAKEVGGSAAGEAGASAGTPGEEPDTNDNFGDGTENSRTRAGAAVGTPAYMAPEQGEGRPDVGPAADVFALGATLYHLLTGRPRFAGEKDIVAVLRKVSRNEFPRPRQVNPGVPAALEAVCLKAMAPNPADRYPDALALAADVERWLSDEPVSCYREPWRRRLARWGRRHRVLVNSTGVGFLLAVAALGFTTVRVNAALDRERYHKERAELRFAQAQQAVNDYLFRVADDPRLKAEDLQPLRRALLGDAQKYYADFLAEKSDEPQLRAAVAAAELRRALIEQELGNGSGAEAAYERGFAAYDALLRERPDEPAWRVDLARGHANLGALRAQTPGGRSAARESYGRALELLEPVAENPVAWEVLARTYSGLGAWQKAESPAAAVPHAQKAVELCRRRWAADQGNPYPRRDFAQSLIDLATLHTEARRFAAAKAAYEEALDHWRAVAAAGVFGFGPQAAEGRILHDLAIIQEQLGAADAALQSRQQALAIRESTAYGHGAQFFTDLARTENDYGLQLVGRGGADRVRGAALVADGRRIREKLASLTNSPRELLMLVESLHNDSNVAVGEQDFPRGSEALAAARGVLERLPGDRLATFDALRMAGWNRHLEGYLFVRHATALELAAAERSELFRPVLLRLAHEKLEQAKKALAEAYEIRSNLGSVNPESVQALGDVSQTCVMLGNVALRADKAKAAGWYTQAGEYSRRLLRLSPEDLSAKLGHAVTVYSLANAVNRSRADLETAGGLLSRVVLPRLLGVSIPNGLELVGRPMTERVGELLTEAVGAAHPVFLANPTLPQPRLVLESSYRVLLDVRVKQGRHTDAVAVARGLREVFGPDPSKLVGLAGNLAALARAASRVPALKPAENAYADEAVATLTRAADAGFKNPAAVTKEPFAVLAGRADYQALLRRLGSGGKD